MTLLLLSALLASAAAFWVIHPILDRRAALLVDTAPGQLLDAEARKRVALASLKEVEYDYLAGKLDEADYQAMRERLSAEALQAIRAAEAVQAAYGGSPSAGEQASRRAGEQGSRGGEREHFALRTSHFALRVGAVRGGGGVAHPCGFVNPAGSRFCAGCGVRLS